MNDVWRGPTLFGSTSGTYDTYRIPYPEEFFNWLLKQRPGAQTVLDLGCGTGLLGVALAERGLNVTMVDPDPNMLSIARRKTQRRHLSYTRCILADASRSDFFWAPYDVAVMGQSFHWMDRRQVVSDLAQMMPAGGVVCVVDKRRKLPEECDAAIGLR